MTRTIGMSLTEGSIGFNASLAAAQTVGVKHTEVPQNWDQIEPAQGVYQPNFAQIADQFYPTVGVKFSLGLNPIDTNSLRVPAYLAGLPMNHPSVIAAFKAMVDYERTLVHPENVLTISIGNEVDAYLGTSTQRWNEYRSFFQAVAPYVRSKFPGAVVGVKMTYGNVTSTKAKQLNQSADAVLVTYYPFVPGTWAVADTDIIPGNFGTLANTYPSKNLYFMEIGYPSGTGNGSSEAIQAWAVHVMFQAWDQYAARIPLLNFVWLHEKSQAEVDQYVQYYGINDPGFASFLGSLGLRTNDGVDKLSFVTMKSETMSRGFV